MSNSTIWWVILIVVILLGSYFLFVNREPVEPLNPVVPDVPEVSEPTPISPEDLTIELEETLTEEDSGEVVEEEPVVEEEQ